MSPFKTKEAKANDTSSFQVLVSINRHISGGISYGWYIRIAPRYAYGIRMSPGPVVFGIRGDEAIIVLGDRDFCLSSHELRTMTTRITCSHSRDNGSIRIYIPQSTPVLLPSGEVEATLRPYVVLPPKGKGAMRTVQAIILPLGRRMT